MSLFHSLCNGKLEELGCSEQCHKHYEIESSARCHKEDSLQFSEGEHAEDSLQLLTLAVQWCNNGYLCSSSSAKVAITTFSAVKSSFLSTSYQDDESNIKNL